MQKASVTFRYLTCTALQRSCGKAMFSQVSVCPSGGVGISCAMFFLGWISLVPGLFWGGGYVHGVGMSMEWVCPWGVYVQRCVLTPDMGPQGGGYVRGRWVHTHPSHRIQQDTVGKPAVRILLK